MLNALIYLIIAIAIFMVAFYFKHKEWECWWSNFQKKPYNFPIKYKGKTIWYSRPVAVTSFIFARNILGEWCVLANQRGQGCLDYQWFYNASTGYVNWSETAAQSAQREILKGTNVNIPIEQLQFYGIDSDPIKTNRQNITIRFFVKIEDKTTDADCLVPSITEMGEKDEVSDVRWIPISSLKEYNWAFGHKQIIEDIFYKEISQN